MGETEPLVGEGRKNFGGGESLVIRRDFPPFPSRQNLEMVIRDQFGPKLHNLKFHDQL